MASRHRAHLTFATVAVPLLAATALLTWLMFAEREWGWHEPSALATDEPKPVVTPLQADASGLMLPKKLGSLRFAVIGDVGRGDAAQYDTASEMARWRERFDFAFVLMLGDNMYGPGTQDDYAVRFERPYKSLLDAGVVFYAANGNHDPASILYYKPYNMDGRRYYSFTKKEGPLAPLVQRTVRFLAIDTVRLDATQLTWIRNELGVSNTDWEICFFHHPLYTSGRYSAAAAEFRRRLEPLFVQYGADVALAGHEHFYERLVPQKGVLYFTSGAGGALRIGDLRQTPVRAAGFDADTHFVLMEISGSDLFFQAISRTGQTIDAGHIQRLEHPKPPPSLRGR